MDDRSSKLILVPILAVLFVMIGYQYICPAGSTSCHFKSGEKLSGVSLLSIPYQESDEFYRDQDLEDDSPPKVPSKFNFTERDLERHVEFNIKGDDVIVFLHIQKTGGTTFGRHLVRNIRLEQPCDCKPGQKKCTCHRPGKAESWLFSRFSTGWSCGLHADWTELTNCVPVVMGKKEAQMNKRHDGTDSPDAAGDVVVALTSFQSKVIKVRVQKKADRINEDLLSEATESRGLWDSVASITGAASRSNDAEKKEDVLNIFSVASGHLYERFLRIMMLSVLRHTKTPVKFWFLKNFLSPSFKEAIPHMAEAYGFQYELVQYKWPRWLHQQTEKQRLIWGYKILFLDVLFPLAVDKIIFVDADQIVRADLKELRDLPLDGAPYGYTPFCDSRREMDGYRFWKSGYWASHLGHRKYHISALYVVDLKKFRKIAAGDRLRGQYQALSQDPNSLSNLDQDLPNNMIHQVAIKSLPQEWLWCETWCDDVSKGNAKTIDLCNNPRTKEPKLTAAARIVPEWVEYDNDIKRLLRRIQEERGHAPVQEERGHAPVQEERGHAPVQEERGHAPVQAPSGAPSPKPKQDGQRDEL
ncbi:unnamed protein product [Lota lota]